MSFALVILNDAAYNVDLSSLETIIGTRGRARVSAHRSTLRR
jgi:hypothetical protein